MGSLLVAGDDALGVAGGVGGDVSHSPLHTVHHPDRQDIVQELGVKVPLPGGRTVNDGGSRLIQPQLHRRLSGRRPAIHQPGLQLGKELSCNLSVHKAHLGGVAHAGPGALGVLQDVQGHPLVGPLVHIDVADAGARLDHRNGGVVHAGPDQARAPPGDEQVHIAAGRHQLIGGGAAGVLHQLESVLRQARGGQPLLQGGHNGGGGAVGLLAAPEHTGGARLQRQSGGVAGDVGTALIDDGDDPHRDGGLFDHQPVGPLHPGQHGAHRVGEGGYLPHPLGHAGDALGTQRQPVQHHLGDGPTGRLQVLDIGGQNVRRAVLQGPGHLHQRPVFQFRIRQGHGPFGAPGLLQQFHCRH